MLDWANILLNMLMDSLHAQLKNGLDSFSYFSKITPQNTQFVEKHLVKEMSLKYS